MATLRKWLVGWPVNLVPCSRHGAKGMARHCSTVSIFLCDCATQLGPSRPGYMWPREPCGHLIDGCVSVDAYRLPGRRHSPSYDAGGWRR